VIELRPFLARTLAIAAAVAVPFVSLAERPERHDTHPAAMQMLGSGVSEARARAFSTSVLVGEQSIFAVLKDTGSAAEPKFEASGLAVVVLIPTYPELQVENARVALMPSADGKRCRFEISGAPFTAASRFEASGTFEWGAGPLGGDKLDIEYRLADAPVEAVRTKFPNRMNPAFQGVLRVSGKGSGVVGETTSEEAPATPLRGSFEAGLDLGILGRVAPLAITSDYAADDRMVRLSNGHLKWQDHDLGLRGWFSPEMTGNVDLVATFANVDAKKVAESWNVPPPWQPVATLTGNVTLKGLASQAQLRYEATAPTIDVPGLGGYPVHLDKPKVVGSLLAINAEASASFREENLRVGDLSLGSLPLGIQWFREELMVSTANTTLWGGDNDMTLSYKPAEHPAFIMSGRLIGAKAPTMLEKLAPWTGLQVEGTGAVAYVFGQDAERNPRWGVHATLGTGRIGNIDLFARVFDALAGLDPALRPADPSLIPVPRLGTGTRIDKLFFETVPSGDGYDIGGLFLRASDFQIDADGHVSAASALQLDGTMMIPPAAVDQLASAAPWLAPLRIEGGPIFVPIVVGGTTAAPTVQLGADYPALVAAAKRGETVTAPRKKDPRHVGADNVAKLPGDPTNVEY
jgi:hypothetical protein